MVLGNFDSLGLESITRLQFASGAVQPVIASPDGTVIVGTARVVIGNIPAANGVLHIINDVLTDDASINSTAVAVAAKLGDFGPFNKTKARANFQSIACQWHSSAVAHWKNVVLTKGVIMHLLLDGC